MGTRSDIRILTSVEGFEKLNQFVKSYANKNVNDKSIINLLEKCDLQYRSNKQCYLGWNGYDNWNEYFNKSVAVIMEGLSYLKDNDYSYRFYRLGEDKEDYEEHHFDSTKTNEQNLDYPNITRQFDDRYMVDIIYRQRAIDQEGNKDEIGI